MTTYNSETEKWDVSGYKYDYVLNPKGLIIETLVYEATDEAEDKWPLILRVKNFINDSGIVFRSERYNYKSSKPYIERWSNIIWDRHDGNMPISGYAVQGANRIKSAKMEYQLMNDQNPENIQTRIFTSEYQNDRSFHYTIVNSSGKILSDNSYYRCNDYSLQEFRRLDEYMMQYYDFDDHNRVVYDHYVEKTFYEGDNVITHKDWHVYTSYEYYLDSDAIAVKEQYQYDALTDSEPYGRSRWVYSDFKEYDGAGIINIASDADSEYPRYYNLQGMLIQTPQAGQLLIRKVGNKAEKIIYR